MGVPQYTERCLEAKKTKNNFFNGTGKWQWQTLKLKLIQATSI